MSHAVCSSLKIKPKFCLVLSFTIRLNFNCICSSLLYFDVFVACLAWQMIISKFLLLFRFNAIWCAFFHFDISLFQGFCGWSLVVYDRLLIPSNPGIGVLRYKDNYYAFCDKQAAYEFSNAPERYIGLFFRAVFFAFLFLLESNFKLCLVSNCQLPWFCFTSLGNWCGKCRMYSLNERCWVNVTCVINTLFLCFVEVTLMELQKRLRSLPNLFSCWSFTHSLPPSHLTPR